MTRARKLLSVAAFAILGSLGTARVAAADHLSSPSPCASVDQDAAREARERDELARFVARLGARERGELERYIWRNRLGPLEAERARAHLAYKQRIRDAQDFRHLEDQQRERAMAHAYARAHAPVAWR